MRTTLAILDFTRMMGGRICFAGVDRRGRTIRPTFRGWIEEKSLIQDGRLIVYPFAVIDLDLRQSEPEPPHVEDWESNPWSIEFIKEVAPDARMRVLEPTLYPCISEIFGSEIYDDLGFYVMRGEGERSIGTIQPAHIDDVFYDRTNGRWRICFTDQADQGYCLSVTDRTWWAYHHHQLRHRCTLNQIVAGLKAALATAESIYLRIGLSRNWVEHPDRCFLQINAIYTLPNYFGEDTFSSILLSDMG